MMTVRDLTKTYKTGFGARNSKTVVDHISFSVERGETFGIIGESGCGKTSLAKMALKLIPATSGQILVDGTDVTALNSSQFKPWRKKMQFMFQNPESSLNPRIKLYSSIAEALRIHHITPRKSRAEKERVHELAEMTGLQPEHLNRYPHELSGGQVQRAVLARTLALGPELLIADEPTSMLDVSVQAQILTILREMQARHNLALIFIAHDLDVIRIMCDRVLVMHNGKALETGDTERVFSNPSEEYTRLLIEGFYCLSDNFNKPVTMLLGR
jgi:peptide/nickel transport system ATP-binding protein/oligopeptide transport system ATP-binding protein